MKTNLLSMAEEFETLTKTAGGMSRKDVLKQLEQAKKEYSKHKDRHDTSHAQVSALHKDVADAKDKMQTARKTVLRNHDLLKCMDLSNADEVRFRGDDVSYVKDKKEYSVKVDGNGEVSLTPYKKRDKADAKDKDEEDKKDKKEDKNDSDDFDFLSGQ